MPRTWKTLALTGGLILAATMTVGCGDEKAPPPVKQTSDGGASRPRPGDAPAKGGKKLPTMSD